MYWLQIPGRWQEGSLVYSHFKVKSLKIPAFDLILFFLTFHSQIMSNTQKNIGKERKSYRKNEERWKAHTKTWKHNWVILTITDVFLDQKTVNLCLTHKKNIEKKRRKSYRKMKKDERNTQKHGIITETFRQGEKSC